MSRLPIPDLNSLFLSAVATGVVTVTMVELLSWATTDGGLVAWAGLIVGTLLSVVTVVVAITLFGTRDK